MAPAEHMIDADGVELCTESFGDPAAAPILLVMGVGASMLWWEEGFCQMLADVGRLVIRYDHRDTGRSVSYPPGRPGYTGADLVADAAAVLDGYRLPAAHVVGVSAGGALAQLLALNYSDRVLSLVLISTSPATPGDRTLPPATERFTRFVTTAQLLGRSDTEGAIEHLVNYAWTLAGGQRPFDEAAVRSLLRRDADRARDFAAAQNHDILPPGGEQPSRSLASISVPTLVIHGSADPMFPLEHGEALAEQIPDARLMTLQGAGHGVERVDWPAIVDAIARHTAVREGAG